MVFDEIFGSAKQTAKKVEQQQGGKMLSFVVITIAALYIISPIDFMPDFIPIIGWIDDAIAAVTALGAYRNISG
jgi:uncharacterized membrane protein YkvA (DUF1232 family)